MRKSIFKKVWGTQRKLFEMSDTQIWNSSVTFAAPKKWNLTIALCAIEQYLSYSKGKASLRKSRLLLQPVQLLAAKRVQILNIWGFTFMKIPPSIITVTAVTVRDVFWYFFAHWSSFIWFLFSPICPGVRAHPSLIHSPSLTVQNPEH